jgi:hypothetical protein
VIPLTAEELETLVKARDLLHRLGSDPLTGGGLCTGVADGIKLILKCSHIDPEKVVVQENPLLPSLDEIRGTAPAGPVMGVGDVQ